MNLDDLIALAHSHGASDLHLEGGLPAAIRIRGSLQVTGDPIPPELLRTFAEQLIGSDLWPEFEERRSFDLSKAVHGVRCRINILQTTRGVGFAIRLLSSFEATIERLNLHPDIKKFVSSTNGMLLISGPTGSGKSSTLAALIQEINQADARHIVTIESPIEYTFKPCKAFIRQREVGRDTPSFDQALLDALREDPDVLMVGEMREPETMRLTLNASETGHLVLTTVHSSTCIEAIQRVISAFPAEIQSSVAAQLADCLVGVICQRLQFRQDLGIRIPECEILVPTNPVKNFIRNRDFFKMSSVLETGADHGMWTFQRYRSWMERRPRWFIPEQHGQIAEESGPERIAPGPATTIAGAAERRDSSVSGGSAATQKSTAQNKEGRIEIEPVAGGLENLLKKLR